MRKVSNRQCIRQISRKSMAANKKRNPVLIIAIALTAMMLTTLFTIGSSILKSVELNTMYQVGTSSHAGFKFLTQKEYDRLKQDSEIRDLSYSVIVGDVQNEELYEDQTEVRYAEKRNAKAAFSLPTQGRLPEQYDEAAVCTAVLDDFGLPHEPGQTLHLKLGNGLKEYEGDFRVCGIWEKPAETMVNQIYVSEAFQKDFSPVWRTQKDKDRCEEVSSFAGSINPDFNFKSSFNLDGQMKQLKERCGFDGDVNDGVNWAYAVSSVDLTTLMLVGFLLLLIFCSGYLIISNIFLIAVSSDIHYYGLLKTIGTTNRQLKRIVTWQGGFLSLIGIPAGLLIGFLISIVLLPFITSTMISIECQIHPNLWIFLMSAVFAWLTVRISCFRPCRVIKKVSPVEAVNYSGYTVNLRKKERKGHRITPFTMAWENLKRSRRKNAVVILSIALSILLINVTVTITSSFDENLYISSFISTDFMVMDGALAGGNYLSDNFEVVEEEDAAFFRSLPGVTEAGCLYFSESQQPLQGESLKRARKEFKEHPDWFILSSREKDFFHEELYKEKKIPSHIYGADPIFCEHMDLVGGRLDEDKFRSGRYAIVSSPVAGMGDDAEQAFYHVGETIDVAFPGGAVKSYEVMAVGDIAYSMGPEHGHGLDINIALPAEEYLRQIPESEKAMKFCFNAEKSQLDSIDETVEDYCKNVKPKLGYSSRKIYLKDFNNMVHTFLLVGGLLSLILALIGLLNYINLTCTSIQERASELATLRAVGMTGRQMEQMLTGEGLIRIGLTFVLVLSVGMLLNNWIVHLIAGGMVMFRYRFVIWPMLACIPVFLAATVLVSRMIIRQMEKI